jgi:CheY-like chemotaxis protein
MCERALGLGAFDYLSKPIQTRDDLDRMVESANQFVNRNGKSLLLLEADAKHRSRVQKLLKQDDVRLVTASSGKEALDMLRKLPPDCLVLGPRLADMSLRELTEAIAAEPELRRLPIIVHSERVPTVEDQAILHKMGQTRLVRSVFSADGLLDHVLAALHYPLAKLPPDKRETLRSMYQSDVDLVGKKVLIVDDDIRNIFALSSVLEWRNMIIHSAETGRDAIDLLQDHPDIDVVLMDIMMPEMDGYETIRAIRQIPRFRSLPIIAVTAKAMKGDREKCIEAGAWDYLAKPVDSEQMLAVLRAWLQRREEREAVSAKV